MLGVLNVSLCVRGIERFSVVRGIELCVLGVLNVSLCVRGIELCVRGIRFSVC